MIKNLNKTDEILERLAKQEEVRYLNSPEDIAAQQKMNKMLEDVRRDYILMDARSRESAKYVVLT